MDIGPGELLIVVAAVLLLFGGSRIPQLARSLGQAQSEFRRGLNGTTSEEAPSATADPGNTPEAQ